MIYKLIVLILLIIILQQHEINFWTNLYGFFNKISRSFCNETKFLTRFYDNTNTNFSLKISENKDILCSGAINCEEKGR